MSTIKQAREFMHTVIERNKKFGITPKFLWNKDGVLCFTLLEELVKLSSWRPMEEAVYDDSEVLVYWFDGRMTVEDLDHDSDAAWWKERGALRWMPKPEEPDNIKLTQE